MPTKIVHIETGQVYDVYSMVIENRFNHKPTFLIYDDVDHKWCWVGGDRYRPYKKPSLLKRIFRR